MFFSFLLLLYCGRIFFWTGTTWEAAEALVGLQMCLEIYVDG